MNIEKAIYIAFSYWPHAAVIGFGLFVWWLAS